MKSGVVNPNFEHSIVRAVKSIFDNNPDAYFAGTTSFLKVKFKAEGGTDGGGLNRELFSHIGEELQSGLLEMLVPTPNAVHRTGVVHDLWIPNPKKNSEENDKPFFEFLGGFLGFCFRNEQKLCLQLPSVVYKAFSGAEITWSDLKEIDMLQYDHLMDLYAHPKEQLGKHYSHWIIHGVSGAEIELCSEGKHKVIKYNLRFPPLFF